MTADYELTVDEQEILDEAMSALDVSYEEGDDGDGVRLALNAIAGLLGERFDIDVPKDDGLNHVLKTLKAKTTLRSAVRRLYKAAEGGAYGENLSEKDADKVNALTSKVFKPLREFVENPVAAQQQSKKGAVKTSPNSSTKRSTKGRTKRSTRSRTKRSTKSSTKPGPS